VTITLPAQRVRVGLRGAARDLLKTRTPEVLLAGPAGTGKSFAALMKVHLMALANPGMRALMVRKTHRSLAATGLVTFREHVAKEAIAAGICKWYGGSGERPAQYVYENGSVIIVGGMDNPEKIMSMELDVAYVQEATELTPEDWEKITTRLRNGAVSFQQLIADCNPQQPSHWLKKRADDGRVTMLHSRHEDNPRLFDGANVITEYGAAYMAKLDALSGVRKERLRWGRWAAAEGLIYEGWDPRLHLSDRKKLPFEWRRVWSVDFGFRHPFVWQQWAIDDDGRLWLELEIHSTERIVEDHAKSILEAVTIKSGKNAGQWKYPRPSAILCDHDAEDRATLERYLEMATQPAWKTVSDGIQAMAARLRVQADGRPRMYVLRDSLVERDPLRLDSGQPLCFAEEIEGYVWEPAASGRIEKDRPVKERDDAMDCARYVVAWADLQARPRVRWIN
jgi:PBSX family phage terminase large subunit